MKEYIIKDEFSDRLREYYHKYEETADCEFLSALDDAICMVEETTAEDVEPVVHCVDCKWRKREWSPKYGRKMWFCDHMRVGKGVMSYEDMFYCGYGERKKELKL